MSRKSLLYTFLLFVLPYWAFAQPPGQTVKLTQLETGRVGSSPAPGLVGVTNANGKQKYVAYVNVADNCVTFRPTATGNLTNLNNFVQKCSTDSIWYIDFEGRSMFLGTTTAGGGVAPQVYTVGIASPLPAVDVEGSVALKTVDVNGTKVVYFSNGSAWIEGGMFLDTLNVGTINVSAGAITGVKINQMGATNGQVLKWNGTTWAPDNDLTGGGAADNWGTQVAVTTARLSGNGTSGNPLDIAQNGAASGHVLRWNGTAWAPDSLRANNGVRADGGIIKQGSASSTNAQGSQLLYTTYRHLNGFSSISVGAANAIVSELRATKNANNIILDILQGDVNVNGLFLGRGFGNISTNAIFGENAFLSNTTGFRNTVVGGNAFRTNSTGYENAVYGYDAMRTGNGNNNVAIGAVSLYDNRANSCIGIGGYTLYNNRANGNIAIGNAALTTNTTGASLIAVGSDALRFNTTGYQSIAIGNAALKSNTIGYYNLAIGPSALENNIDGYLNVALGLSSLIANTTGALNTAVGASTLFNNTTGSNNVAFGREALRLNITGNHNVGVGYWAGVNGNASFNTSVGSSAGKENITGTYNAAFGYAAILSSLGSNNTGTGANAGIFLKNGSGNTFVGFNAAGNLSNATTVTAIKVGRQYEIQTVGTTNFVAIGAASNTVGVQFTATGVGSGTGFVIPLNSFSNNTFIGSNAALNCRECTETTVVGANVNVNVDSILAIGAAGIVKIQNYRKVTSILDTLELTSYPYAAVSVPYLVGMGANKRLYTVQGAANGNVLTWNSTTSTWAPAATAATADFWRTLSGSTLPDGTNDVTETITRSGQIQLSVSGAGAVSQLNTNGASTLTIAHDNNQSKIESSDSLRFQAAQIISLQSQLGQTSTPGNNAKALIFASKEADIHVFTGTTTDPNGSIVADRGDLYISTNTIQTGAIWIKTSNGSNINWEPLATENFRGRVENGTNAAVFSTDNLPRRITFNENSASVTIPAPESLPEGTTIEYVCTLVSGSATLNSLSATSTEFSLNNTTTETSSVSISGRTSGRFEVVTESTGVRWRQIPD